MSGVIRLGPQAQLWRRRSNSWGGEAGRGIREALCSAYGNHALPPHPNPSSQPAEFPSLELKRRPAAGKGVRGCGLSFQQHVCMLYGDKMIWHGKNFTTDGIKVKICLLHDTIPLFCCVPLFQVQVCTKRGTRSSVLRSVVTEVFWSEPDAKSGTFLNTQLSSFWMDQPECHEEHAYIQRNVDLDLCNLKQFYGSANMIKE